MFETAVVMVAVSKLVAFAGVARTTMMATITARKKFIAKGVGGAEGAP
jgi:hypothetical protein